ncbi:MAG: hypothetical protein CMJ48_02135 [Planctomycetaceae bacterium]|nr:hypothetical protein [Planctomycetaceae bacterium]
MRIHFGAALVLLGILGPGAQAASQKFPYKAIVTAGETYVRSGYDERFYPTMKLKRGDVVVVNRHDLGGQFRIEPPDGSFSWIRSDYVRVSPASPGEGTLTENDIVVRVGSVFGKDRNVEQRRLRKGDRVKIIDQESFQEEQGTIRMYKIRPPKGEYRWIDGRDVVPAGEYQQNNTRNKQQADPFPGGIRGPIAENKDDGGPKAPRARGDSGQQQIVGRPVVRIDATGSVRRTGPDASSLKTERNELRRLDAKFDRIAQREKAEWDFSQLRKDYQQLLTTAVGSATSSQIQLRLNAVDRYEALGKDLVDLQRLTSQARKRDAELLSLDAAGSDSTDVAAASSGADVETRPSTATTRANDARANRPFVGAGIVQRSATAFAGGPPFVLLTPTGRILAYIQPQPGVKLEHAVGRAMGIYGKRSPRADLQTDLINATGFAPVRLIP